MDIVQVSILSHSPNNKLSDEQSLIVFVRLIVRSIIRNTIIYDNFFTVPVLLTHNKMTQYLYHFAEKTEKRRRIREYIVHCSYFLKMYIC